MHAVLAMEPTADDEPTGQLVHAELPALLAYFPALQSVQLEAPDDDSEPTGQLMQFRRDIDICPVADKYVPDGHGVHSVCPEPA